MVPAFGVRVFDAFEESPQSRAHDGVELVVGRHSFKPGREPLSPNRHR